MSIEPQFYTDKDIARLLCLSPSWVRVQRHKRKHGLEHVLSVDPIHIGSSPRYIKTQVDALIASLMGA